jgi:hypothetical protein
MTAKREANPYEAPGTTDTALAAPRRRRPWQDIILLALTGILALVTGLGMMLAIGIAVWIKGPFEDNIIATFIFFVAVSLLALMGVFTLRRAWQGLQFCDDSVFDA